MAIDRLPRSLRFRVRRQVASLSLGDVVTCSSDENGFGTAADGNIYSRGSESPGNMDEAAIKQRCSSIRPCERIRTGAS
jgi:hypothetical protein